MRKFLICFLIIFLNVFTGSVSIAQSVAVSKEFTLGSPFSEPDGRSDVVKINATDFVTLAKVKGNESGKSDFVLQRYDAGLSVVWSTPLSAEEYEDYKELYFNGKEIVLLSVIHKESEKQTKLEAYGFNVADGKKVWTKELESYTVGDWEMHQHKGKVKESFIDLICEHIDQDFVTDFEYKHTIHFSPDQSKFVSYVFNYGEPNLTASVSVYDNAGNLLKRGKVGIDNDYTNHGIFVNNSGLVFILNASNSGKVNLIRFDLETKDFQLLDLPSSNSMKDDFHVHFSSEDVLFVASTEIKNETIGGITYSKFDFSANQVSLSVNKDFDQEFKSKFLEERKKSKQMKGEEDWMDYDLTHVVVNEKEEVFFTLEKRVLHADGYPHVGRSTFDKSHKVEFTGHIQAENILLFSFTSDGTLKWQKYLFKNQIYPANDGLNTISYVLDSSDPASWRILFTTSENMDGSLKTLNLISVNKETGAMNETSLPNEAKLTLVKDYSLFTGDRSLVVVGKKGMLGKASVILKYEL